MIREKPSVESINEEALRMIDAGLNQAKIFINTLSKPINNQQGEVLVSISDDFQNYQEVSDKINKFTNDLEQVNQDVDAAKANSKKFVNAVKNMKNHLNAYKFASTNLKIEAEELKTKLDKFQNLPAIKVLIKNLETEVVDLDTKIKGKLYYLKVLSFSFEGIEDQISRIKSEFSLNKLNDRIAVIKEQIVETKQMVDNFKEITESYKKSFEKLQPSLGVTTQVKGDVEKFAKLKLDANIVKRKADDEHRKLEKVTPAAVQSVRLGFENLQIKLNKLNKKRANLEHLISELTQKLLNLQ